MPELLAQTTTTVEVPRVVGDHPGSGLVLAAAGLLLAAILLAGVYAGWRSRRHAAGNQAAPSEPGPKRGGG